MKGYLLRKESLPVLLFYRSSHCKALEKSEVQKVLRAISFQGVSNWAPQNRGTPKEWSPQGGQTVCSISSRRLTFSSCSVNSLFSRRECSSLSRAELTGKGLVEMAIQRCKCIALRTHNPKSLWEYSKKKPSTSHPPFSPKSSLTVKIRYWDSEPSDG